MPSSPVHAERNAVWAARYLAGERPIDIARSANVSRATVNNAMRSLGVQRPVGRPGITAKQDSDYSAWDSIKRVYGLTREEWHDMLVSQSGRCAVCGDPMKKPVVDHCHQTGKVRGLLHHRCNVGLPYVEESGFLAKAQDYLEAHRG